MSKLGPLQGNIYFRQTLALQKRFGNQVVDAYKEEDGIAYFFMGCWAHGHFGCDIAKKGGNIFLRTLHEAVFYLYVETKLSILMYTVYLYSLVPIQVAMKCCSFVSRHLEKIFSLSFDLSNNGSNQYLLNIIVSHSSRARVARGNPRCCGNTGFVRFETSWIDR